MWKERGDDKKEYKNEKKKKGRAKGTISRRNT
jgi:hypothetical protein